MKVGDKIPVNIAGQVVAQASVKSLDDGTVTLIVPATLVVMAVRTEIAPDPVARDTTGTETLITGVERSTGESTPVQSPEPVTSAPVGETVETPPTPVDDGNPKTTTEPSAPTPPVDNTSTTVQTPTENNE